MFQSQLKRLYIVHTRSTKGCGIKIWTCFICPVQNQNILNSHNEHKTRKTIGAGGHSTLIPLYIFQQSF